MRKGRWHGAAVTEGSIRLDVLTKPGSTGTLGRSLSQPTADSSLYAREPLICHALGRATLSGGEGCLRRGITVYLLCCLSGISPGDSSTGCYTAVERGCEKGDIHKNTPQLFYKLWRNFLSFPGGSGGRAGERGYQFASFDFFSSYIQVYPQSFPGFPQNLSTAVDTAVDKFKSLFGITCSGRHRWLRHPSYRHPWPG